MFRLFSLFVLWALIATGDASASSSAERVALFVSKTSVDADTCRFAGIEATLQDLRFATTRISRSERAPALTTFGKQAETSKAAMLFVCDPIDRQDLPTLMRASKLNFLFLIETQPAPRGAAISDVIKTDRNDLVIVHVRLGTPENREIFANTLVRKLKRPYSAPYEILSRTVVSAYYRSRGTMITDLRGQIASGYVLTTPPTEKILDAWSRVQHTNDRAKLEAFIAQFPKTLFADLARSRLEKLP